MPNTRMSRFAIFIGAWNTTGEIHAVGGAPASELVATDTYRWMPGRHFIMHDADARMGKTVARSTEIIGYDAKARQFFARAYDDQGGYEVYEVDLRGKHWSIRGRTVRFSGRFDRTGEQLAGLWEMKSGRRWEPWIDIRLVRA